VRHDRWKLNLIVKNSADACLRLIPLSQVTATMARADVLEASEAGRTFLVAQARGDPVLASYRGLIDSWMPEGRIEYPGTAG
jgi:hypothetical protein